MDNYMKYRVDQLRSIVQAGADKKINTNPDTMTDTKLYTDLVEILSDPNPDWRDVLIGILLVHEEFDVILHHIWHNEGTPKAQLNALNLLIIFAIFTQKYYADLIDDGVSMDKRGKVGTTLFDAILTEWEERYHDMESMAEGFLINSKILAQEYGI